jgi:peptide/nickel transport system substrate-binding protein
MIQDVIHPAARRYAAEHRAGTLSRREFLARATSLGVATAGAYALIGLPAPARADNHLTDGGTVRIESTVKALRDPRTYDWPQMSNFSRGWLEYLVEYNRDGSIGPMLLESWQVNDDATEYVLNVRPGVTWNDGTPFTAQDVAYNIARWCERGVEGNSMASRVTALIDDETGEAREGAITVTDDATVTLTLVQPDITLIAGFSDYPAAIVPQGFGGDPMVEAKGTGPYLPESLDVGVKAVLVRNDDHDWWGTEVFGPARMERIEFIDFGEDQAAALAAADAGEVDMLYETLGDFVDILDGLGWVQSEAITANTLVIRPNQKAEVNGMMPYADARVRRALAMAVSNDVLLELGYAGRGVVAENHHVSPLHPEYAPMPAPIYDPEAALALLAEAGMTDFEHDLVSIDDDWRRPTADVVAGQLRDAGIPVKRTVLPGSTFWNDWTKYAFSATDWAQRPLGVQVLALAYRTGEPWNETGFSNAEFDALLAEALALPDASARQVIMARLQEIMRDEGVVIQPYWRSTYRHNVEGLTGSEMHPTFEIHPYKLAWAA